MKTRIQILIITVMLGAFAVGQSATTPLENSSPDQLVSLLTSGSAVRRGDVARYLNLREPWEQGSLCEEYEKVESTKPALELGSTTALIAAKASDCDFTFLVPFVERENRWKPAGVFPMWTKYSSPRYRIESLITSGESEIVISGQTVDSGSGVLQRNLTILKLVDGSIRVVFDQPEALEISVPAMINGKPTNTQDKESSTFAFVKSEASVPGLKSIAEKRVIHVAGQTTTVYRKYEWTPLLSIFRMYGTGPSEGGVPGAPCSHQLGR